MNFIMNCIDLNLDIQCVACFKRLKNKKSHFPCIIKKYIAMIDKNLTRFNIKDFVIECILNDELDRSKYFMAALTQYPDVYEIYLKFKAIQ